MAPRATPRRQPYIWVTWLAKVMAGEARCGWQHWFLTHHQLNDKRPPDPALLDWQLSHSRMLSQLRRELTAQGVRHGVERQVEMYVAAGRAKLSGKIDCMVERPDELVIYDCKSGRRRSSDEIQVMIYLRVLSSYPRYAGRPMRGIVRYEDGAVETPDLSHEFHASFDYFTTLLASDTPPPKAPGAPCRFCSITRTDCPERQEWPTQGLTPETGP